MTMAAAGLTLRENAVLSQRKIRVYEGGADGQKGQVRYADHVEN
jgi:hypothetical protein